MHVTLLTPERFRGGESASRLYQYKFSDYGTTTNLLHDLRLVDPELPRRSTSSWSYPDITDRTPALQMHWVTYEELIEAMPQSELGDAVRVVSRQLGDR